MKTSAMNQHSNASARARRDAEQTIQLGTFADGQRAAPVTVTYSAEVGSFGRPAGN
jgi:hypothetical protein